MAVVLRRFLSVTAKSTLLSLKYFLLLKKTWFSSGTDNCTRFFNKQKPVLSCNTFSVPS